MERSIDVSIPVWLRRYLAVGILAFGALPLFKAGFVLLFDSFGISDAVVYAWVLAIVPSGILLLAIVSALPGESESTTSWDPVSKSQYIGQFAESGGLARREQQKSLDAMHESEDE